MADTIDALIKFLDKRVGETKVVVWVHNSHLGDASATEMGQRGEWNIGQLMRERWGTEARNIGFTTYTGTVTAATDWDGHAQTKRVLPALRGSWEETFHDVGDRNFLLRMQDAGDVLPRLREPLLE